MTDEPQAPPGPEEGETDAQWRLRRHSDPADPFTLGELSLAEVQEAVAKGWPEARSQDPS